LSRTDAHSPFWVPLAHGDLAAQAQHASAHAVCDLPDQPPAKWEDWLSATNYRWAFHYTGTNVCSCWMCHAGPQHRQENRNKRHRDRVALRAALGRWRHGDQSAFDDLAPPSRTYCW